MRKHLPLFVLTLPDPVTAHVTSPRENETNALIAPPECALTIIRVVRAWHLLPETRWLHFRTAVIALAALFAIRFTFYCKMIRPISHY